MNFYALLLRKTSQIFFVNTLELSSKFLTLTTLWEGAQKKNFFLPFNREDPKEEKKKKKEIIPRTSIDILI